MRQLISDIHTHTIASGHSYGIGKKVKCLKLTIHKDPKASETEIAITCPCLEIIDYALSYVSFHSRIIYLCTEFSLMYVCFLLFSLLGHWFGFTFIKLIMFSSTFLVMFLLLHIYYHFLLKSEAININNHLIKRKM